MINVLHYAFSSEDSHLNLFARNLNVCKILIPVLNIDLWHRYPQKLFMYVPHLQLCLETIWPAMLRVL